MERKRAEYKSSIASKNQIKHAFASLLYVQPLNKITVTAIIEKAGISRSTFYAHYNDIDDLMSTIIKEETERFIARLDKIGLSNLYLNPKPLLLDTANYIADEADYYKKLFLSDKSGEFINLLKKSLLDKILADEMIKNITKYNEYELRFYCSFFVSAILVLISDIFNKDVQISKADAIEIVSGIIERTFSRQ